MHAVVGILYGYSVNRYGSEYLYPVVLSDGTKEVTMLYIVGERINLGSGMFLWDACNGATRQLLRLLRAENVTNEQFVQHNIPECSVPAYRVENATVRWIETPYRQTDVFVVAADVAEPDTVYVVLNDRYGFNIIPHPQNPSPTRLYQTSVGHRACAAIAVVTAPVFVARLNREGFARSYFYLASEAPYELGPQSAVITKALAGDTVCQCLIQQAGWQIGTP